MRFKKYLFNITDVSNFVFDKPLRKSAKVDVYTTCGKIFVLGHKSPMASYIEEVRGVVPPIPDMLREFRAFVFGAC